MNSILKLLRRYWPFFVFAFIYIFIFRKVFFANLVPFPGDLLVTWFFPYNSGGWEGYTEWISHKEFILADVVRQIYPWRILSVDLLKDGLLPLWNIYSFSGTPLLADMQSAIFYPLNVVFLFIESRLAWIIYIMVQPILATVFMYMFIRSIGLSQLAAIFAGIGFAFIGYTTVWFEIGVIGHAALWLPFILWGITKFIDTKRLFYIVLSALGIGCSILAGHAQTTAYILLFSVAYLLYSGWGSLTKRQLVGVLLLLSLGITLAGVQIVPTIELMNLSPRDATNSERIFNHFITPPSHIAMLFAPDFFGNPATGNFWGKDYGEFMSYSGIAVLLLGTIGFFTHFKNKLVRLSLITIIIAFLIAFVPPVSKLLFLSQLPILSTGLPSRALFLVSVCLVIVSAFGIEAIRKEKLKKIILPIAIIVGIYIILGIVSFSMNVDPAQAAITKRNLLLPTGIAFLISLMIIGRRFSKHFFILWIVIFSCMGFEYSFFINKYLPWAPIQFMYPSHEFVNKISEISGTDRVFGYDTARIETNLPVQWRIQSAEGYDPLYIRSYAELMHAGTTGKLERDLPRSDALLPASLPAKDSHRKQVLLNLLGVKYVLDKEDNVQKDQSLDIHKFPADRFALIYQESKWRIYQNKNALPRAAVFYDYAVILQKEQAIATLYDENFPYDNKLILENAPKISAKALSITPAKITTYNANNVEIQTNIKQPGILFLSDNNYPGWTAFVDNRKMPLLQADYTFRAVEVPSGEHIVRFEYRPLSFYIGMLMSLISLFVLGFFVRMKLPLKSKKKE